MVKRDLSFAFFFALSLITGVFIAGKYNNLRFILIFAAVLAASYGIQLLNFKGYNITSLYLIAASLGLITAFSLVAFSPESASYLGVGYRNVSEYMCTAEEDSYRIDDTRIRFKAGISGIKTPRLKYSAKTSGLVLVTVEGYGIKSRLNSSGRIGYGEKLEIKGKLKSSGIPGINYFSYVSPEDITYAGFSGALSEVRFNLLKRISGKIDLLGYPESELFRALFLGIKDEIPEEITDGFTRTGTLHILALSGLHAGIIFFLASAAMFWLPGRSAKFIISSLLLAAYVLLTGFKTSLVRASLMIIIGGLGLIMERDSRTLNILSLAAAATVLVRPFSVFTLSFQLSFSAVFGIITLGKIISVYLERYLPAFLRYSLSTALGAQLAVAPILLYRFGVFYFIGFAASMLTVPVITLFIWFGILFILLPAGVDRLVLHSFSGVLGAFYNSVNYINRKLSEIPGIVVKTGKGYIISLIVIVILSTILLLPRKYIYSKGENV